MIKMIEYNTAGVCKSGAHFVSIAFRPDMLPDQILHGEQTNGELFQNRRDFGALTVPTHETVELMVHIQQHHITVLTADFGRDRYRLVHKL